MHTLLTTVNPRRVRDLRRTYEVILRSHVSDQAPTEEQHAWWRLHDAAKHEYAVADWKWESLVLRVLIGSAALVAVASLFVPGLTIVAIFVMVVALWRCYVIFTRHAPE